MAKKETTEIKLTEKEKKQIKNTIMDDIKDDLTTELSKTLVEEVNKSFDSDYKDELKEKISNEIALQIKEEIRKEEKRISRKKSWKIFRLYVYIVLLLALVGFILYKIYDNNHMEILGLDRLNETPTIIPTKPSDVPTPEIDLMAKYAKVLDDIKFSNTTYFGTNTKVEELSLADRIALAYNAVNKDSIEKEGSIYTVDSSAIETAYNKIYNTGDYTGTAFNANGIDYKYSAKTNTYIAIVDSEQETEEVLTEIKSIREDDTYLYVTILVAVHKGDYIYNKDNLKSSVSKYSTGLELADYAKKLTTSELTFVKGTKPYLYSIN